MRLAGGSNPFSRNFSPSDWFHDSGSNIMETSEESRPMFQLRTKLGVIVLAGGIALGGICPLATPTANADPSAEKLERHPHLRRSLHELREARKELQTGDHDFGGHRVEAIKAVDVAIKQIEIALRYDRR
jgi:hypothetical protein